MCNNSRETKTSNENGLEHYAPTVLLLREWNNSEIKLFLILLWPLETL